MGSVITSIARTPIGRYGGGFQSLQAVDLGPPPWRLRWSAAAYPPSNSTRCSSATSSRRAPGRSRRGKQRSVRAVPMTVPATTINKVCLSGMTAIANADKDIRLGEATFVPRRGHGVDVERALS